MDIEQRVERLERENRRLKLAGAAVVAVLLAVALVGAVMPQEIIEARGFRVTDENGELRAEMGTDRISYYDENGNTRATMTDAGIAYYDAGRPETPVGDRIVRGVIIYDEAGKPRAVLAPDRIAYYDENGKTRISMGADGIFYIDAEGNVIWQAPR